jgi:pimeloyl-ACP methyl ester carboxylesterase
MPTTPPPQTWKRFVFRVLRRLILCYLIVLFVLLALEDRLLFAPGGEWSPPPADLGVTDVQLRTHEDTPIHAWWSAPKGWKSADGAILFCHGNGGNLSYRRGIFKPCHELLHAGVLMMDYPGYGRSGGSVNEAGCYAAADAAYDWLTGVQHVEPQRLILMGGSLGGAVAIDVAVRRPSRALFLVASFTSFPDMAQSKFPWLPGRWLVHNQFDSLHKIPACPVPVFVAHDRDDGLIPFHQAETLFAAAPEPKQFIAMSGVRHNDQPSIDVYLAFRDFLAKCDAGRKWN